MKIVYLILVVRGLSGINSQYDIGDSCLFDEDRGIFGVCKIINMCEYASKRISEEIHPPVCGWLGKTRIACCPDGLVHETGVFSRYFQGSNNGVLRNDRTICRYNGYLPMVCCPNEPDLPQSPEPRECPRLPRIRTPSFSDVAHEIAWKKCVENRRYVDICEQDENDFEIFKRTRACKMVDNVPRISGGLLVKTGEFPHMAALGCQNSVEDANTDIVWVGGGSLISDRFILTAGHVLLHPTHLKLRYALLGVVDKTDVQNGDLYNIIHLIPHKLYTTVSKYNDIALVELDRRVKFSEFIRPICLPVPGIESDESRIIAGWGDIVAHVSTSKNLVKTYIQEVNESECSELQTRDFTWNTSTMICARGQKLFGSRHFSDSCEGDSGGPLMSKVKNNDIPCNYVLHGVVSWGPICGVGAPGAYTRVSAYLNWIVNTTWSEEVKIATASRNKRT